MEKDSPKVEYIDTIDLQFDPENPRFFRLNNATDDARVIEEMLDDEGVQDLMASIGQKGYFEGEPLLVTNETGKMIVVEGNRRLAAVKLLNKQVPPPSRRRSSVDQLRADAVVTPPTTLPCIVYKTRRDILRYLGYRHITGIKEWDSLSKARYLAEIRDVFYKDLEKTEQMKALARDIGSRSDYVAQLLTSLNLYEKAQNKKFFNLPMTEKDVEFSYITTALNYKKITDWLGLEGRSDNEAKQLKEDRLERIFGYMFPKNQQGKTILGESRNLDQLADVVASEQAEEILKETGRLSEAYLFSEGPQQALSTAIQEAVNRVQIAYSLLPNTKPLTQEHMDLAERLVEDARTLRSVLRDKLED